MRDVDIYGAADKAIRAMDRAAVRDFGTFKAGGFDELNVIREVTKLYRTQRKKAKQRYYEVGFEAYLLALYLCGIEHGRAQKMAEKTIDADWVDELLKQTDFVTKYRFEAEADRKAQRLIEALSVAQDKGLEVDRAMKAWAKQLAQYAICVTDAAVMQAYEDAGLEAVMWVTEKDERVCHDCRVLDGRVFPLDEVPVKPHWGCRCRMVPAEQPEE